MCGCGSRRNDLIVWVFSGARLSDRNDGISKSGDVEDEEDGLCGGVEEETDRPMVWVLVRDDSLTTAGGAGQGPTDSIPSIESVELVSSPEIFDDPERFKARWV